MKLVCYGASVTAQKFETGFFHHICEGELKNTFTDVERICFGASQYEYAGYAFMNDVLKQKPDVCVIDWLTPSMKAFNEYKISLLNKSLLEQNCLPIWVFFPRKNNFEEPAESYFQVKKSAESFNIPFLDLRDNMADFIDDPSKYLRDAVHTTLSGATLYAQIIEAHILQTNIAKSIDVALGSQGFQLSNELTESVPLILDAKYKIDDEMGLQIDVDYQGGFFEIFFETEVGPHLCKLIFSVFQNGSHCFDVKINPADPWSHYARKMVVETLRRRMKAGKYTIKISKEIGNPFDEITTRKPIETEWNDDDRFIALTRVSLNSHQAIINQIKM